MLYLILGFFLVFVWCVRACRVNEKANADPFRCLYIDGPRLYLWKCPINCCILNKALFFEYLNVFPQLESDELIWNSFVCNWERWALNNYGCEIHPSNGDVGMIITRNAFNISCWTYSGLLFKRWSASALDMAVISEYFPVWKHWERLDGWWLTDQIRTGVHHAVIDLK